jgi:adenosine deaminase CECR1
MPDGHFQKSLSPTAVRACEIVSKIRAREAKPLDSCTQALDGGDYGFEAHASQRILDYRSLSKIQDLNETDPTKTDLWKIVQRMPKGSLLHAHLEAIFEVDYMIDQWFDTPGIHMCAEKPLLNTKDFNEAPFKFQYASSSGTCEPTTQSNSIWMPGYEFLSLIPIYEAAATFPRGGKAGFRAWLKSRCIIMPEQPPRNHHHGLDGIWAVFGRVFPIVISIMSYEPIFRRGFRRALSQLATDGIQYAEFRMGGWNLFQKERHDTSLADPFYIYRVLEEEINLFIASAEGKNFYGVRIIYTAKRSYPMERIMDRMEMCIRLKRLFPTLICGFDLVGQEDQGRSLVELMPTLLWFRKRCRDQGLEEIPLFLHAGECLGDGDTTDQNVLDAILLGSRRIGHGFSVYKHPLLIDMIKKRQILIECCPISNQVLGLTSSIKLHPLPALLSRGVPVALCNDDPALFGCGGGRGEGKNGLTHDFFVTLQALENLGLAGLGNMAKNSVRWSCYEDQSDEQWQADIRDGGGNGLKAIRLRQWYFQFEEYCQWIVAEFGDAGRQDDILHTKY